MTEDQAGIIDGHWWNGFNACLHIVDNVIHGLNFTLLYKPADILDLIEDEIEQYKKDG